MAQLTLQQILERVGAYTDQEAEVPTNTTDLQTRINYVNRALDEYSQTYDWDALVTTTGLTASAASTVSLALPASFDKPMGALYEYDSTVTTPYEYPIIPADERFTKNPSERFGYVMGSRFAGFTLIVPRGLASGASLVMDIKVHPSSLATLTDSPNIENAEYLVHRATAYVLESRGDSRFPLVKADADRVLAQMVENKNAGNLGMNNQIPMPKNFHIGRSYR